MSKEEISLEGKETYRIVCCSEIVIVATIISLILCPRNPHLHLTVAGRVGILICNCLEVFTIGYPFVFTTVEARTGTNVMSIQYGSIGTVVVNVLCLELIGCTALANKGYNAVSLRDLEVVIMSLITEYYVIHDNTGISGIGPTVDIDRSDIVSIDIHSTCPGVTIVTVYIEGIGNGVVILKVNKYSNLEHFRPTVYYRNSSNNFAGK